MVARTESLWDRFAAIDPGLIRLTSAMRAVLGAAATLAVLTALQGSDTALLAGGFTAMVTSLAISDLHPRNQFITLGIGAPLSLAALTVGAVLTPYPTAAKTLFLLLIHLAVRARRFGARGLGLGIFGFMAFFLSQFAQARVVQLPQLGAAVLVAFGAVATVWYCAGPRTAYGVLTRLRRAFDGRLHDVLRDTASMIATGQDVHTRSRALERRLDRLHASVLLIEGFLDERAVDRATDDLLLRHVSRVEVAAQRLAVLTVRAARTRPSLNDPGERTARQRLAARIQALLHRPTRGTAPSSEHYEEQREDGPARRPAGSAHLRDCFRAVDELTAALEALGPRVGLRPECGTPPREPATPRRQAFAVERRGERDTGSLKRAATRQASQVTVASALAIVGGHLLSPHLWYWAVAASWVVFIKNESTGEVLLQGLRRLTGTVIGVVVGYGLAALVGGDGPLLLVLLLVCMFGMFYTPSVAYWAVTFFLTCMLSLLLALLGTFSTHVLLLRVEETALGVACGILAAVLVLPTTVRRASDEELINFLLVLHHLLRATTGSPGAGTSTSWVRAAHDLDQALQSFGKASSPLTHPLNPHRGRRDRARHLVELLEAAAYHARSLAATAGRSPAGQGAECATRLAAAADRAQATVTQLIRIAHHRPGIASRAARPRVTRALSLLSDERRMRRPDQRLLLHIDHLDATLIALARALDPLAPEPGRAPGRRPHGIGPRPATPFRGTCTSAAAAVPCAHRT
ncbi:FUSC family protein [Streptomyces griseoaurantiacus]|uniref:FUSC family protein n=1 Tax=Streptomyces griseoaurantiacus TaxID=68213 RepID=UPI00363E9255